MIHENCTHPPVLIVTKGHLSAMQHDALSEVVSEIVKGKKQWKALQSSKAFAIERVDVIECSWCRRPDDQD